MSRSEIIKFIILRTIGNFLVLFMLFGFVATFGPALYFEVQFRILQARGIHFTVAQAAVNHNSAETISKASNAQFPTLPKDRGSSVGFQNVISNKKEQVLVSKDTNFGIVIPKIGANASVVANVDPSNPQEFLPALQIGVAHAKGTVFPGFAGTIYLFAHSVDNFWEVGRYNAIFYLLKDLTLGDDIIIFFENVRHNYVVSETKIVDPSDVSYIVNSQQTGQERLILQTCWPPGTTWKRLLVIARPK